MKQIIIFAALLVFYSHLFAQNSVENILVEIEKNNTTLMALRKSIDVEQIGNKTGIYLSNPEAEFNYLWGSPSVVGNRTDFSIKQAFDFPTAYSLKNQISELKNEQAELEYVKQRNEILFQTRVLCVDLIYSNALKRFWDKRHDYALKIAEASEAKLQMGHSNILDFNKAQVNLLNISKELENNEIQQNELLAQLKALNGGLPVNFADSVFPIFELPTDFEQWFQQAEAQNPLLQWVRQEVAVSEKQVKLHAAEGLPKFFAGYMSENVVGERFQGLSLGVTIPLWENKNTVRYAKAQTAAWQEIEVDSKLQFYNRLKATYDKVVALQNSVSDFRSKLALYSNSELLDKAFNKGEISLTEYLFELSLYTDSMLKLLEFEHSLSASYSELIRYQ